MERRRTVDEKYERDERGEIIGEKPEARLVPGNHMGPRGEYGSPGYGYTLNADGSYELAPGQRATFDGIAAQINTIHNLVNSIFDHARTQLHDLEKRKAEWFKDVARTIYRDDDMSKMTYVPSKGIVKIVEEPPASPLGRPKDPLSSK